MTSSARASRLSGTPRLSAFAVPQIDHHLVLDGFLHRQVGWLVALENTIHITSRTPVLVDEIRSVQHQTANADEAALVMNSGQ